MDYVTVNPNRTYFRLQNIIRKNVVDDYYRSLIEIGAQLHLLTFIKSQINIFQMASLLNILY